MRGGRRLLLAAALVLVATAASARHDPLPSWRDGATRARFVEFVRKVTTEGGRDDGPPADRIAGFDNDGPLWSEQPHLLASDEVGARETAY